MQAAMSACCRRTSMAATAAERCAFLVVPILNARTDGHTHARTRAHKYISTHQCTRIQLQTKTGTDTRRDYQATKSLLAREGIWNKLRHRRRTFLFDLNRRDFDLDGHPRRDRHLATGVSIRATAFCTDARARVHKYIYIIHTFTSCAPTRRQVHANMRKNTQAHTRLLHRRTHTHTHSYANTHTHSHLPHQRTHTLCYRDIHTQTHTHTQRAGRHTQTHLLNRRTASLCG